MKRLALFVCFVLFASLALAQGMMSPEELLFTEKLAPVATITKVAKEKIPASITTITKEQIEITPARNIFDLIEVYVPGAFWMIHNEDPHVGIRGINADRNYKLLILVNGRKINQDAVSGALAELEMWDLNDIEKIEVVRGPGSVTHGPGAIEGVVSITTKNAQVSPGTNVGVQYVDRYNSTGLHISHGIKKDNFDLYLYGSVTKTRGNMAPVFQVDTNDRYGYVGADSWKGLEPLHYFRDYNDIPQGKLYAELNFLDEWKLWARFTNWGATRYGNGATGGSKYSGVDGDIVNARQNKDMLVVASLENTHDFSDELNLHSMVSWSSTTHTKRSSASTVADEDSLANYVNNFSESELLLKSIAQYTLSEKYRFATGLAWARKYMGPAWDGTIEDSRYESVVFGTISGRAAYGNTNTPFYIVNGGWNTDRLSWLGEANLEFHKLFNLILSARTDHHTYTGTAFSPRIASISDFGKAGMLKVIWQKSVRINTEGYLLQDAQSGAKSKPETLKGWEIIYEVEPIDKLTLAGSLFTNELEAIGYSTALITTNVVGTLQLYGFDLEAKYAAERFTIGASQSLAKQNSFELGQGQTSSGISYGDYNRTGTGYAFYGEGNDLNNWCNWATKLYLDVKATPKITLHTDARILWGFEGMYDGLEMVNYGLNRGTGTNADNTMAALDDKDIYGMDFRLNLAVKYAPHENLSATVFALNLLGANDNKRYGYDAGVATTAPNRAIWVEEPRTWGIKINCKF